MRPDRGSLPGERTTVTEPLRMEMGDPEREPLRVSVFDERVPKPTRWGRNQIRPS